MARLLAFFTLIHLSATFFRLGSLDFKPSVVTPENCKFSAMIGLLY